MDAWVVDIEPPDWTASGGACTPSAGAWRGARLLETRAGMFGPGEYDGDTLEAPLADLLADLAHLARARGIDFGELARHAVEVADGESREGLTVAG